MTGAIVTAADSARVSRTMAICSGPRWWTSGAMVGSRRVAPLLCRRLTGTVSHAVAVGVPAPDLPLRQDACATLPEGQVESRALCHSVTDLGAVGDCWQRRLRAAGGRWPASGYSPRDAAGKDLCCGAEAWKGCPPQATLKENGVRRDRRRQAHLGGGEAAAH